ncbi:alpha/beta fold hydrolase [Frankia sp. AgB32]|uniref:alpha/beta fold hydrolase n=1 Tax=Frankia sp. AgB32 TaxID=631119 RepID=UPI0020108DE6|nr:alpha/beta hydrolase [Frankia sp. AgB32]MCK9897718.1 alpha/beta hydrolase [Frankia sp. AgB32]
MGDPPAPLRRVPTPYGTVEFADLGGSGMLVLVLHGNGGGWDQGVDWARRRLGEGFRAIAVSRYGYLGSELPAAAGVEAQADALAALLDALGLDRVGVVSLSAGSTAGAYLALRHPDRVGRFVLESPVLPAKRVTPTPPAFVLRALLRGERGVWWTTHPTALAHGSGLGWRALDAEGRAELAAISATLLPVAPRRAGMMFDFTVSVPRILADELRWAELTCPTLVVTARDSPLPRPGDAAALTAHLPHGRLLVLPTGGHLLLGNVARLRTELAGFLAGAG